jgi:hypothetical protein
VGTQVLNHLSGCVKVADCCDPFSTGTLTCVKLLETFVGGLLPPYPNDS